MSKIESRDTDVENAVDDSFVAREVVEDRDQILLVIHVERGFLQERNHDRYVQHVNASNNGCHEAKNYSEKEEGLIPHFEVPEPFDWDDFAFMHGKKRVTPLAILHLIKLQKKVSEVILICTI